MKGRVGFRGVAEPIAAYGSDSGEVVLYQTPDGTVTLDVRLDRETRWLNLNQISDMFDRDKSVISPHLRNIFKEKELERDSTDAFLQQLPPTASALKEAEGYKGKSPR